MSADWEVDKFVVTVTTGMVKVLVKYSRSTHVIEKPCPASVHGLLHVILYVPRARAMWCSGTPGHRTERHRRLQTFALAEASGGERQKYGAN